MWSQTGGHECLCHHIQNDWENGVSAHCILSKLGKYCKEINFVEDSTSRTQVFERFYCFKEGWQLVESNKHPTQLLMRSNSDRADKVCALFKSDRRLLIREMSKEAQIFISLCHAIVSSDLGVRQVVVWWQVLIAKQKEKCLFEATDLFQCTESDSGFLRHISTVKETQIYGYDPETKAQSSVWKSPLSPQQDKSVAHSSISPPAISRR
jgi:hypothetical protein